jgi:hypothetical protein
VADDDDEITPTARARPRPPTDSDRQRHWKRFEPGTPVVRPGRRPSYPEGVPTNGVRPGMTLAMQQIPDEERIDTGVFELLDRAPSDEENEIVRRTRRESRDPLTVEDGAKLLRYVKRMADKADESATRKQNAQIGQLEEILSRPTKEVAERLLAEVQQLRTKVDEMGVAASTEIARLNAKIVEMDQSLSPISKFAKWALGVAAGAVVAVGIFLYQRGFGEGGASARYEYLERTLSEVRRDMRALERREDSNDSKGHVP